MANLPFHIPHICHSITDPLSFADLLKCILVSRHWHDTFIPILWSDAVTFRSLPRSHRKRAAYHDYSLLYYGHQGILKHAHHIRALTCQGAQSLQTLVDSFSCVNLVEINLVINLRVGFLGFDNLVDLMSVNSSLRAISIENVDLSDKATESQLHGLLDFLDRTPSITSVCLTMKGSQSQEQWGSVWGRMYSRIDRNTIHSLCIQSGHLSRSKRALMGGRTWPVRETPLLVQVRDTAFRRVLPSAEARWENETRSQRHRPYDSLTVLENSGSLELCAYNLDILKLLWTLLQRPPPVSRVTSYGYPQPPQEFVESVGTTLRQVFPNLRKLDISREFLAHLPLENIFPSLTGLSSLSLSFDFRYTPRFPLLLSTEPHALSSLKLQVDIPMSDFFSIVTRCPSLLDLKVSALHHIQGPEVSPPWICKDLRKLDIQLMYRDTLSHYLYNDDPTFELEMASAKRLAPSLLQQLGGLAHLRDLCLGLNEELKVDVSPFFQLSVDPVLGMPKLAGLQQLKTFKVTGLRHSVGQHEIEWMRANWPLLFSLDIPIMVDAGGHRRQAWVRDFGGLAPAYEQWYPGLKVLIPESIDGCDMEDEDNWDEFEHEETIWALDDEYHLSKHYNVHTCEWWSKPSRRQTQCGHRVQRH
ncbi:hypothetical protein BG006_009122 [Podila minutissima]|uniref:F-box domain-containing protein n=1 Tax=Podila minutissima TaxID=64525 RepID=A0A9P5SV40_9FUNG|nr:hypothetical protein BG006_009122 [Podila minutissima]